MIFFIRFLKSTTYTKAAHDLDTVKGVSTNWHKIIYCTIYYFLYGLSILSDKQNKFIDTECNYRQTYNV